MTLHLPDRDTLLADLDQLRRLAHDLTPALVADMWRRAEHPQVDAWCATPAVENRIPQDDDAAPTISYSDLTGNRGTRHIAQREDDVRAALIAAFIQISEARGMVKSVHRLVEYARKCGESGYGHTSAAGNCLACGRPVSGAERDRLTSGYCSACYKAWQRAGYPDRLAFERARPAWQNLPA